MREGQRSTDTSTAPKKPPRAPLHPPPSYMLAQQGGSADGAASSSTDRPRAASGKVWVGGATPWKTPGPKLVLPPPKMKSFGTAPWRINTAPMAKAKPVEVAPPPKPMPRSISQVDAGNSVQS